MSFTEMITREFLASIAGLILVVSAVVLLGFRAISFENALVLISIGLSVFGFSTFQARRVADIERRLNRILYSFRELQPVVTVEDGKVIVTVHEGMIPDKLVEQLGKLYNLPVEVRTHKGLVLLGDVVINAGDAIKPMDKNWEGSLGYFYDDRYYTNAHVLPQKNMDVVHVRTGTVFGKTDWVSPIKTVSWFQYLMSFFGYVPPVNKVDAASIVPTTKFIYYSLGEHDEIATVSNGDRLVATGRTSGRREGVVESTNTTIVVKWPHNGKYAIFGDVIKATFSARPGDSGGSVVDGYGRIVGLVFAGPTDGSFALIVKASNIRDLRSKTYIQA